MEACCSFKTIVDSCCGFDAKDRKRQTEIVPLLSCSKDISNHLSTLSFSGPENEIDLILSRAALYDKSEESIKSMTICPHHRATLGISWTRGGGTRCRVPQEISGHGKSKGSWPKGDRGLGKQESSIILCNTGVFVPPGSGRLFLKIESTSVYLNIMPCNATSLCLYGIEYLVYILDRRNLQEVPIFD